MNKIAKSLIAVGVIGGIAVAYCNREKISKAVVDAKKEIERKRNEQTKKFEDVLMAELSKAFEMDGDTFRTYGNPQPSKVIEFGNSADKKGV